MGDRGGALATALLGVAFLSMALQGHVSLVGPLAGGMAVAAAMRALLFLAGLTFAMPGIDSLGLGHLELSALGLILAVPPLAWAWQNGRRVGRPA